MKEVTVRSADGPLPIPNPPRVTPHTLFSGAGLKRSAAATSADVDRARAVQQHLRVLHHKPDWFWKKNPSNYTFTMGKVEGGMKCVKYLLFVFNFIFWVSNALVLYLHAIMCGILVYCAMWSQFCVHFASHLFVVCVGVFTHFMQEFKAWEAGWDLTAVRLKSDFPLGENPPLFPSACVCLEGSSRTLALCSTVCFWFTPLTESLNPFRSLRSFV